VSRTPFFTSVTRRTMPSMETVVTFASGIIFLISSSWFLYAVLPTRALFPLGSACIFSSLFVALSVKAVKRKGLLVYCPRFLQQWFLNFSLLEFLTDPALKELVSKIVPLFMNPNQTELERTLKTLPPSWRKRLLTKRLVDALPTNLRAIMLPAGVPAIREYSGTLSTAARSICADEAVVSDPKVTGDIVKNKAMESVIDSVNGLPLNQLKLSAACMSTVSFLFWCLAGKRVKAYMALRAKRAVGMGIGAGALVSLALYLARSQMVTREIAGKRKSARGFEMFTEYVRGNLGAKSTE